MYSATTTPPETPLHPVRVVIRRTGLSADLLRAWERRYGAVQPLRSPGGQRLYRDEDVERLQLLRRLTALGHPIGRVATLETSMLREMLLAEERSDPDPGSRTATESDRFAPLVESGLRLVEQLDGDGLEALLRRSTQQLGIAPVIEHVVSPVMREIGERWHRREVTPAHEHLATNVIERTLHWMLDGATQPADAPRIALATIQGERHEVGIQVAAAIAAAEGWRAVYLGADLPAESIVEATLRSGARVLALSVAASAPVAVGALTLIRQGLPPRVAMILGGSGVGAIRGGLPPGITALGDLAALRAFLHSYPVPRSA